MLLANFCSLYACLDVCIRVDPWETQQNGWTLTADVLKHYQETINKGMYCNDDHDCITQTHTFTRAHAGEGGRVKLLCGADLLESFSVPGLWESKDVRFTFSVY